MGHAVRNAIYRLFRKWAQRSPICWSAPSSWKNIRVPGIGRFFVDSVINRDYTLIMELPFLRGGADIDAVDRGYSVYLIDPRIKLTGRLPNGTIPTGTISPAQKEEDAAEEIRRPSISYWADVWRRLFQNKLAMTGLVLILLMGLAAIIVPTTTGISYFRANYDAINVKPSSEFLFGTDNLGRDMLTRVWVGTRYSLIIGLLAALIDFVIGVSYGGIAGMASRRVDTS